MIFFRCKIRFIYVGFNGKRKKSGVKKCLEICAIKGGGGGGGQMAKTILNFNFDYLTTPLIEGGAYLNSTSYVAHYCYVLYFLVIWVWKSSTGC